MVSSSQPSRHQPLALLSVTDKAGISDFARGLVECGFKILSTGGTASKLQEDNITITEVAKHTGHPEILDGRVKTLHPKIHGGILADWTDPAHVAQCEEFAIDAIQVVVVNLYQFAANAVAKNLSLDDAIEYVDVGGPTMIRAAAKNFKNVLVVVDPGDYARVLSALRKNSVDDHLRQQLAAKAFALTASYDRMIADYFARHLSGPGSSASKLTDLPETITLQLKRKQALRYGENPHQQAGWYYDSTASGDGLRSAEILHGKELSYNNLLDLNAAVALIREFREPTAVVIKHTNPCGACSTSLPLAEVFDRAFNADSLSAFGGIVAVNDIVDIELAQMLHKRFLECVVAPEFTPEALAQLQQKTNLRLLRVANLNVNKPQHTVDQFDIRSIGDSLLIQNVDRTNLNEPDWRVVTATQPSKQHLLDAKFAMRIVKHVKSNAIVFAKQQCTLAVGAGQMSRVDSARFAIQKARETEKDLQGSTLASDAFFPFRDTVDAAAAAGVKMIIQPGGSVRDEESIAACDEHGIAMIFTGQRHFRH